MNRIAKNRDILGRLIPGGPESMTELAKPSTIRLETELQTEPGAKAAARAGTHPETGLSVTHETSRNGLSTIRISRGEGNRYLHSRYDPVKEAARIAERMEGFVVLLGFGCGYLAAAAARRSTVAGVLALEPEEEVASVVLREARLDHLENSPTKLRLLELPSPKQLTEWVRSFYLPAVHDRITLHVAEGYEEVSDIEAYRDGFSRGVELAAGGYRTMARLGRQWSRNILLNASLLTGGGSRETAPLKIRGGSKSPSTEPPPVLILGAGPSLERWLRSGAPLSHPETVLIAADTSEPILRRRGIEPDITVVIDAQAVGYHHILSARAPTKTTQPSTTPIVADLTAPSFLSRQSRPVRFFSGGHPLGKYLLPPEEGYPYPSTEGGNVGYTLLSLGELISPGRSVEVGLDYSYQGGIAYAGGSYLETLFHAKSNRFRPAAGSWTALIYSDADFRRVGNAGDWSYTEPKLLRFRDDYAALRRRLEAPRQEGEQLTGAPYTAYRRKPKTMEPMLCAEGAVTFPGNRLRKLKEELHSPLREPMAPAWALEPAHTVLMPLAAWCKEHSGFSNYPPFEGARLLTLSFLEAIL